MKNKIIGVDLDEVLSETLDYLLEYNNYMIGPYPLKREDVKDYYIYRMDHIDISLETAIDWFREPMINDTGVSKVISVDGSKKKLLELKQEGYSLVVVTARTEDIFGEYTKEWLDNNFEGIFDDIIFANHFRKDSKEKHDICIENGIEYMIEDNYDYAIDLAKAGIKTYLLEKPWNNWQKYYHDNIFRIGSWDELKINKIKK